MDPVTIASELAGSTDARACVDAYFAELAERLPGTVVRLDTSRHLTEAISLYTATGYSAIPRYNDDADADLWFEKRLTGQ